MFERQERGNSAVLVCIDFGDPEYQDSVAEFRLLTEGAGIQVLHVVEAKRNKPDPAMFVGSGKAEEVAAIVEATGANYVLFNHSLTGAQERNLERVLHCRVADRTTLILEIFAMRAKSHEGKLQVELAQCQHMITRLVRGWTHLERQKGGIGMRGGPGETQLELDRRILTEKIKKLKDRLAQLQKQRVVQRKARSRRGEFSVSIVGYTNAGKSTLFNALTHSKVYAADQLFATLDTTSRKLFLNPQCSVVLSDTVGFIRDLPHGLVAAFRATLEETIQADLLLHVVDANHSQRDLQISEVNKVLAEIGADQTRQILVWNKIDLKGIDPHIDRDDCANINAVYVSARNSDGLDLLRQSLVEAAQPSNPAEEIV